MRKFFAVAAPIAAAAAMAVAPSSALAVSQWGGWSTAHTDNPAACGYEVSAPPVCTPDSGLPGPAGDFAHNGKGNSDYCAGLPQQLGGTDDDSCLVTSPVVFTGGLTPAGDTATPVSGCSHEEATASGTDPCAAGSGNLIGYIYVGEQSGTGVGLEG